MKIIYSPASSYPVTKTAVLNDRTIELGVGDDPYTRVTDFVAATVGYNEQGRLNEITDPFLKDILLLAHQYGVARAAVEAIAMGGFSSTDAEPKYAGGVVSEGNRIFTPQEGAKNALEAIRDMK